ncbi:MAG: hypothetical protein R2822_03260 [Spirosomataceae bacterium]
MKNEIIAHIDNPRALEKLYRSDKSAFKSAFNALDPKYADHPLMVFWKERLHDEPSEIAWGTPKDLRFVIIASLVAGAVAKLPKILAIDPEYFYSRNIGFIVFPFLMAYFVWKRAIQPQKVAMIGSLLLVALVYINLLPNNPKSDTLVLACIHLPLFLWAILGFTFVGTQYKSTIGQLDFSSIQRRFAGEA